MRYKPEQKEESRQKIVAAAERKLREHGFHGIGVDALAAEAGLTSGAFYKQFKSKTEVLLEVLQGGLRRTTERIKNFKNEKPKTETGWLRRVAKGYFSPDHRRGVAEGCVLPALSVDAARAGAEAQNIFAEELQKLIAELETGSADKNKPQTKKTRTRAIAMLALMTGGLSLARAVPEGELSAEILAACRSEFENLARSA